MNKKIMNNTIKTNTILIATGGTGGHIYPSLSIINQIQNHLFIIVTDERGSDYFNNFFINKEISFKIFTHKVSSPSNKFLTNKIKSFYQFFVSTLKSMLLIISYKPDAVIGFGGYPSVTPIVVAKMFNIPSIIHEQNAVIGRANKLLSKFSNILALSFLKTNDTKKIKKSIYTGNPVRTEFLEIGKDKYLLPSKKEFFYILIYGGSLGSSFFSEHLASVICAIPEKMKKNIKVIQQVRKEDLDLVRKNYKINKIDAEISCFFEDISKKFKIAHLIITRSGGSSVAEILASNRPAIFIPLPTSLDNHQYENAKFIKINKGGWLINQNNKNINNLENLINHLLQNPESLVHASIQLKKLSNKLQKLRNNKTPAECLSEYILKTIKYNQKVVHTIC
tara:strand:+ start:311 stop:1489 length:1179 start_codon:yes stop_codon:yes gene_type:complete